MTSKGLPHYSRDVECIATNPTMYRNVLAFKSQQVEQGRLQGIPTTSQAASLSFQFGKWMMILV